MAEQTAGGTRHEGVALDERRLRTLIEVGHLEARLGVEQHPERAADHRVVVREDDPDEARGSFGAVDAGVGIGWIILRPRLSGTRAQNISERHG